MIRWLVVITLLVSLVGCESLSRRDQQDRFQVAFSQYSAALRWARHGAVHSFHLNREGKQPPFDRAVMERFSVTGLQILERSFNAESTEANLYIEFSYYSEEEGTLRTIREKQVWWYDEEVKRWFTESDMPDFH